MQGKALGGVQTVVGAEVEELLDQLSPTVLGVWLSLDSRSLLVRPDDHQLLEVDRCVRLRGSQPPEGLRYRRGLGDGVARSPGRQVP